MNRKIRAECSVMQYRNDNVKKKQDVRNLSYKLHYMSYLMMLDTAVRPIETGNFSVEQAKFKELVSCNLFSFARPEGNSVMTRNFQIEFISLQCDSVSLHDYWSMY